MHKPSPARMNLIASIATFAGLQAAIGRSTSSMLQKMRGDAPEGMKWKGGVYRPGGSNPNCLPTVTRNPKTRANVQLMHERWLAAKELRSKAA